jgi:lipopolysaccharide export system protein LptA
MRRWLGLSVCILAVGCINTSVQRLDHAVRPARSLDSVTVLLEKPERPYTVIAVIEAKARTVFDSFDDLRRTMVAEAAKLGGEAVILGSESTDSEFVFTGSGMIESDQRRMTAEVIVYERGE